MQNRRPTDRHNHNHSHDHDCPPNGHDCRQAARHQSTEEDEEQQMREEEDHFWKVVLAFQHYESYSLPQTRRLDRDFLKVAPELRKLLPRYREKISKMQDALATNQRFLDDVTSTDAFFLSNGMPAHISNLTVSDMNKDKMRSTLKSCVREWSEEGAAEREMCYGPLLKALEKWCPDREQRKHRAVLNPGCGLGRLTWEIANLGFRSEGNEFSYFMLLTSNLILNHLAVKRTAIHPFVLDTSNVVKVEDQLRQVMIPDVAPFSLPREAQMSMSAGEFIQVYKHQRANWDCIVTCFFLDTANNVLEYVRLISQLLRPGGVWINLGPLLYHYSDVEGEVSVELSYEELRSVIPHFGLTVLEEQLDVPCTYTLNPRSMMRVMYKCAYFMARKDDNRSTSSRGR